MCSPKLWPSVKSRTYKRTRFQRSVITAIMFCLLWIAFRSLVRLFRDRRDLILENIVLRQQLVVLKRRHPRPALHLFDKLFWATVSWLWPQWKQSLIVVTPETVIRWHRAGFHKYWRLISRVRQPIGRRPTSKEVRELIFRMVAENPTWGAPRIHVIPILIVIVLFLATARVIHAIQDAPKPTAEVEVTAIGHQFWWEFRYPALGIVTHCLARPST